VTDGHVPVREQPTIGRAVFDDLEVLVARIPGNAVVERGDRRGRPLDDLGEPRPRTDQEAGDVHVGVAGHGHLLDGREGGIESVGIAGKLVAAEIGQPHEVVRVIHAVRPAFVCGSAGIMTKDCHMPSVI